MSELRGRICLVTGANSGIGKAASNDLARMGATVVMVCRDESKGESARKEIMRETGNQSIELMIADFSSLESVRKLASDYRKNHDKLHVLLNNAGLILGRRIVTEDGLEETFEVNYLSHFLLTYLLLDTLKVSAPSRIVNISSSAHYSGHLDFQDLQGEKKYSPMKSYSQTKLAQVLFTRELAKRLDGTRVTANAVHPGAVRTNWGNEGGVLGIGIRIARPFLLSAKRGAETPVYVASAPELESVSGKYFSNKREEQSSSESYNDNEVKELWEISMKLAGLSV
ncbi:MAG: SDR family oxidoreductase [Nitrososphaerales archaeon]